MRKERVVIESPYGGDVESNLEYARLCMRDCLSREEIPIASHLLYTQKGILDDSIAEQRNLGITMGYIWGELADRIVVYIDKGISTGMVSAMMYYAKIKKEIEIRMLY